MVPETIELLEKQLAGTNEDIRKSVGERDSIKWKIKLQKAEMKKNKTNGSMANSLIRVSVNFDSDILDIQKKRKEIMGDKTSISRPMITFLLCKHKLWSKIKEDLINYEFHNN